MGGLKKTIVAGCNELLLSRIGEEIASQLLAGEAIKRHVLVEGANHVVAIGGNVVILIAMVADGVGIADEIEPVNGQALAKVE